MTASTEASSTAAIPCILIYAARERTRAFVRSAFPRRTSRTVTVRALDEFNAAMRRELVDAAIVDLGGLGDEGFVVAARATDFPSTPFVGLVPYKPTDGPTLARSVSAGLADVLCDSVDEGCARNLIGPITYSARFAQRARRAAARTCALHRDPAQDVVCDSTVRRPPCDDEHAGECCRRHAGAPEPELRPGKCAQPQAGDRPGEAHLGRRALEEPRVRRSGRRVGAGVRLVFAPRRDDSANREHPSRITVWS